LATGHYRGPPAEEYAEAYAWYADRSGEVATHFEAEVDGALALIREAPSRWPSYDARHRKLLLRRFTFLVIYREVEGHI
jgi:hypothetical protein